jgi:hypothetical protein
MPKVNETAILERAKKLCKQDGLEWDFEWKLPLPGPYNPYRVVPRRVLKEEEREEYLARARKELLNQHGDSA